MTRNLLAMALAFVVHAACGDTIHVDASSCPGPGSGTPEDPFCDLADAIAVASPGDVIEMAEGDYTTTAQIFVPLGLDITIRGTAGASATTLGTTHIEAALVVLSDALIEGITFRDGDSHFNAGIVATAIGSATFRNCRFTGNVAALGGGAVTVTNGASSTFEGCLFDGNMAMGGVGGAVLCFADAGHTRFVNCTFASNEASIAGGSVHCAGAATATLENCIVAGNGPDELSDANVGQIEVRSSLVRGGYVGTDVLDALPEFMDSGASDYRLGRASPAIDAGNNALVPFELIGDLAGASRLLDDPGMPDLGTGVGTIVDLGAFERVNETVAMTFYIAPDGDDSNDGLDPDEAWGSWARAFSELRPGDTLIVRNGTWARGEAMVDDPLPHASSTRLPYLDGDPALDFDPDLRTPYRNGVNGLPITVRAENERQVLLRSDGVESAIRGINLRHWTFEGLRGEGTDRSEADGGYERSLFRFRYCEHVELRRLLGSKNNRYFNCDIFEFINSANCSLIENEAYDFHRHGFSVLQSDSMILTRNYANSRGRSDIDGGYISHTPTSATRGSPATSATTACCRTTSSSDQRGFRPPVTTTSSWGASRSVVGSGSASRRTVRTPGRSSATTTRIIRRGIGESISSRSGRASSDSISMGPVTRSGGISPRSTPRRSRSPAGTD